MTGEAGLEPAGPGTPLPDAAILDGSPLQAVRVGVTGHRPNRLVEADFSLLHANVRECLRIIRAAALTAMEAAAQPGTTPHPMLRVVSPLAEGADRIVAMEGIALGFELVSPLPFPRDEYERDFASEASRAEYRALLSQAVRVHELNGSRQTVRREQHAYAAAGRAVLNESDILIAVWDGTAALGSGGTEDIVQQAMWEAIPVVWIQSRIPHGIGIVLRDELGAWTRHGVERLPELVAEGLSGRTVPNRLPDKTTR